MTPTTQRIVNALLGAGPVDGEPTSADLIGDGTPTRTAAAAQLLLEHPALRRAVEAGVAEIARLDAGGDVLVVPRGPGLMAAAATSNSDDVAPVPRDRRVLVEEPGRFRLVYYRLAARAYLTYVRERDDAPQLAIARCDERAVELDWDDGVATAPLGPIAHLWGRHVQVTLVDGGEERAFDWTVAPG